MQIIVKGITGKETEIEIDSAETIDKVKEEFERIEGIPPEQQMMIFRGSSIKNGEILSERGVKSGDTIHIVLALRGG